MSDDTPQWQRKVDHRLRALWARVPEHDRVRQSVRVFLRLTDSNDLLEESEVQVHSVAGDIACGTLLLTDLPRVAEKPGVLFVELAQSLMDDRLQ